MRPRTDIEDDGPLQPGHQEVHALSLGMTQGRPLDQPPAALEVFLWLGGFAVGFSWRKNSRFPRFGAFTQFGDKKLDRGPGGRGWKWMKGREVVWSSLAEFVRITCNYPFMSSFTGKTNPTLTLYPPATNMVPFQSFGVHEGKDCFP